MSDDQKKIRRIFVLNEPNAPRINPALAVEIGLNESIMLLQIEFWISISKNYRDGHKWTFQSVRDMQKKSFPFWSLATINRTIKSLETACNELDKNGKPKNKNEKNGYIYTTSKYNKLKYDNTRWFALNYDNLGKLNSITVSKGSETPPYQNETANKSNDSRPFQNETRSTQNETRSTQNETHPVKPFAPNYGKLGKKIKTRLSEYDNAGFNGTAVDHMKKRWGNFTLSDFPRENNFSVDLFFATDNQYANGPITKKSKNKPAFHNPSAEPLQHSKPLPEQAGELQPEYPPETGTWEPVPDLGNDCPIGWDGSEIEEDINF